MRRRAILLLGLVLAFPAAAQTGGNWVPGRVAELQALDKVTARISVIEAPLDQVVTFGTLEIRVAACHHRPPDDLPDAAVWLEVRDTREGAPEVPFRGWMFAASPGLNVFEHPVYDLRVLACR